MSASDQNLAGPGRVSHVRRVMFVCLGNICRSPLAQGVFEHLAEQRGARDDLVIASSGTGHWHIGRPPDARSVAVAAKHGIALRSRAQQFDAATHLDAFDLFVAMDRENLSNILEMGCAAEKAALMLAFAPPGMSEVHREAMRTLEVPDPYYGGPEGFDVVYQLVHAASEGLLDSIVGPRAR